MGVPPISSVRPRRRKIGGGRQAFIELDAERTSSPFRRGLRSGVVDQDPAHHLGGDSKEVGTAVPPYSLIDQPQKGFMYQGGTLQGMPNAFLAHVGSREAAQLVINQRSERFQRALVALAPCNEKRGYAMGFGFAHNSSLQHGSTTKRSGARRLHRYPGSGSEVNW